MCIRDRYTGTHSERGEGEGRQTETDRYGTLLSSETKVNLFVDGGRKKDADADPIYTNASIKTIYWLLHLAS